MPLKFINLYYDFVLFFVPSPMRSRNSSTVADAIFTLVRLFDVNVCQCCQYSLMLLSICENAQQTYNNINECLTAHSPPTCQRELQGFASNGKPSPYYCIGISLALSCGHGCVC